MEQAQGLCTILVTTIVTLLLLTREWWGSPEARWQCFLAAELKLLSNFRVISLFFHVCQPSLAFGAPATSLGVMENTPSWFLPPGSSQLSGNKPCHLTGQYA